MTGGQGGVLESYDSSGKLLGQFVGHTDVIWSVATGPLDRTLASSGSDQTIRFWNPTTRAPIASFVKATDGEWVMWLPQGFYTSSARGARLLGWQINHGVDQTPDFVTSEQYRRVLHRRDLVERAFALGSADEAVREAFPGGFSLAKLLRVQPPEVRIAGQSRYLRATGGKIRVATYIKSSDPNIMRAFAFVDGRKVDATEVPVLLSDPRPPEGWLTYAFEVELHSGRNEVELVAVNAVGASARHEAKFIVDHEGEGPLDARGKLWIVAIGVDDYPGLGKRCGATGDASCDLSFASIDAEAFSHSFTAVADTSYAETRIQVLTNTPSMTSPTRDNILDALDELSAAEDNDTVVVFLAGHGETGSTARLQDVSDLRLWIGLSVQWYRTRSRAGDLQQFQPFSA